MSLALLALFAAALVLVLFALSRVWRVSSGRDSRPDGSRLVLLILGALFIPPIVLALISGPTPSRGQSPGFEAVLVYYAALIGLFVVMLLAGALVQRFAPPSVRPVLVLALLGREASALDVRAEAPLTPELQRRVELVNRDNTAFPRGAAFLNQADLPGFETAWAALDRSTTELETLIRETIASGTGVARIATDTAADARGRLETLRRAAGHGAQAAVV